MATVCDVVQEKCQTFAKSACCVRQTADGRNEYLCYIDMWTCVLKYQQWISQALKSRLVEEDVVVAFICANSIEMLISIVAFIGMDANTVALLNTRWTASEMATALQSGDENAVTLIICGPDFELTGKEVASMLRHRAYCLSLLNFTCDFFVPELKSEQIPFRQQSSAEKFHSKSALSDRDAMIIFTSGTTGGSKGVRLSHRAIGVQSFAKLGEPLSYTQETSMLASTVPLFHIGGISSCLSVLFTGGKLVFPLTKMRGGFDVNAVRQSLLNSQAPTNTLVVVPAMLTALLQDSDATLIYDDVRLILIGGQSATSRMIGQLEIKFPNASIVQTYACTEAASSLTFLHIKQPGKPIRSSIKNDNHDPSGDCVGVPPPHVSIRLYNTSGRASKIITKPYQIGVIATFGPHVMNGYWKRGGLQENLKGWLLTSDLGYYDDEGRLYFCGRLKDVIRSGGETVLSNEVERALLQHPGILECAVFPREDEKFGEAVACALVVSSPIQLQEIREWCGRQGLATYKRPRYLFLVDSLPRNSSGKILKKKLVSQYGRIPRSKL